MGVRARVCIQCWVFVAAFLRACARRCAQLPLHTHVSEAHAYLTWMSVRPLWEGAGTGLEVVNVGGLRES